MFEPRCCHSFFDTRLQFRSLGESKLPPELVALLENCSATKPYAVGFTTTIGFGLEDRIGVFSFDNL